jgi:hypothetical protein
MATQVYDIVTYKLQDDSEVTCRPLKIRLLRKFMVEMAAVREQVTAATDEFELIDGLMRCTAIAMEQFRPDITPEMLEDLIDVNTMYRVIEAASGLKLDGDEEGKAQG